MRRPPPSPGAASQWDAWVGVPRSARRGFRRRALGGNTTPGPWPANQSILPWAAPQVAPPTAVEERLRAGTTPARDRGRIVRLPTWDHGRPWVPAAAAAMLILSVGLAAASGLLYAREQGAVAQLQAAKQEATLNRRAVAALASGSGRTLALRPTQAGGDGYGVFRMDAGSGQVVLVVQGLPPALPGRAYQGWMHRGTERISVGVFTPQSSGGPVVLTVGEESTTLLSQIDGFGITLEPVGGSQSPTSVPLMTS